MMGTEGENGGPKGVKSPIGMSIELVALHKHWITADSVNYSMRARGAPPSEIKGVKDLGELHSRSLALFVWYGLLFVVIEGYQELKLKDNAIDELLKRTELVDLLRRLRNGTFHYQKNPLNPRITNFLLHDDTAKWLNQVNRAFNKFFVEKLRAAGALDWLKDQQ